MPCLMEPYLANPYASKPSSAFWHRSVSGRGPAEIDPVSSVPFRLRPVDRVATAGSCFAQYISRTLQQRGLHYLITEPGPLSAAARDENYGVYPARFGNVYTVRQLLQLFERAYGLFDPVDVAWRTASGGYIDPFRPRVQDGGFPTIAAVCADRDAHLQAVQEMFESSDVFVFTFGLTEGWESVADGAVFPLAPTVVSDDIDAGRYRFHNFTVAEMVADMEAFLANLRRVNPSVRVILTVSPVALIATYEDRHVLVANWYSKSALRVVADMVAAAVPDVAYFPSYEIITGPAARATFLADDLREVTADGVAHVMSIFCRHYLGGDDAAAEVIARAAPGRVSASEVPVRREWPNPQEVAMREKQGVICDEEVVGMT